jgi:hypothetical protein
VPMQLSHMRQWLVRGGRIILHVSQYTSSTLWPRISTILYSMAGAACREVEASGVPSDEAALEAAGIIIYAQVSIAVLLTPGFEKLVEKNVINTWRYKYAQINGIAMDISLANQGALEVSMHGQITRR